MNYIDLPLVGSKWQHRKGGIYTIVMYTNTLSFMPKYPLTVVYSDDSGTNWSRLYSNWHRSMTAYIEATNNDDDSLGR